MNKLKNPKRSVATILTLGAATFAVSIGCSSGAPPAPEPTSTSYDNLTTDLSICQKAHQVCADVADGNRAQLQTCQDDLNQCLTAIRAAKEEIHQSLVACVDAGRACVAGDGGATPSLPECGTEFRACVRAALAPPPLPPCAAQLKECLTPTQDGATVDGAACFSAYTQCTIAELPPCAQEFATCLKAGTPFWTCAMELHDCRAYRATHDGGLAPP